MKLESAIVLWFTGLSGSGKTTISLFLRKQLENMGNSINILDGDFVRKMFHNNLSFSRQDIKDNNRLIAELAKKRQKNFDFILVPIISPYREDRMMAKNIIGKDKFIELFINTPIEKCIARDPKGLYKKAMSGEINNFIGISKSNPYQKPVNADLVVNTQDALPEQIVDQIIEYLDERKYL